MGMTNEQLINQSSALSSIKKDLDLTFDGHASYQFLVDTIAKAGTLAKLEPIYRASASGNIDTLSVKSRRIREHSRNNQPTGTGGIEKNKIPYTVKKVTWDEWIDNDDVWYNQQNRGENIESTVIGMIQQQFAVDLQDLMFNGDTATPTSDEDYKFLGIMDGFVKKIKAGSPFKTDFGSNAFTLRDLTGHISILPEKYRNAHNDITWFWSRSTYDKVLMLVTDRATGFGDAVLVNGKLAAFGGYPIEIVANMQNNFGALTPMKNLKPIFTRELKYKRTGEGALAAAKDATYHILFAYADAVVRELDAVAWMTGDKL